MLESTFQEALFGPCRVKKGQILIAGFSGGADSLCLLHLLTHSDVKVIAAYFDHSLRPESKGEVDWCRGVVEGMGCLFISESGDVRGYAGEHHLSLEEAARTLRYRFLFDTAVKMNANAVAVAHHADDQVETVLMHLLRGSGASGLAGMRYLSPNPLEDAALPLVRPLLGAWRDEILAYCRDHNLAPVEDATNQDMTYFRNRLRHQLIPELETYNNGVKKHLWQAAAILAEQDAALDEIVQEELPVLVKRRGDRWLQVDIDAFAGAPLWLKRKAIRTILFKLKSTLRDINFDQVEKSISFLSNPLFGKTCQLMDDLEIFRYDRSSVIFAERQKLLFDLWPQVDETRALEDLNDLKMIISEGWQLKAQLRDTILLSAVQEDPWSVILDAEKLTAPFLMGSPVTGESFDPFGMEGRRVKVGDFFTNVHLPVRARKNWPILRSGGRIVWIPGFRIANFCQVTPDTRRFLLLELRQILNSHQKNR